MNSNRKQGLTNKKLIKLKKLEKVDIFLLIFLALLIFLTILCIVNPSVAQAFNLGAWADPNTANYDFNTGLIIVALASFLGALIPFPVPYTLVVAIVASQFNSQGLGFLAIFIMILIGTVTNAGGDMIDYLIGYEGRKLAQKSREKESVKEDFDKKTEELSPLEQKVTGWIDKRPWLIPILLVVFGITPLPDSLMFMPLGVIGYSPKKTLIWNVVGKFLMMVAVAILGIFLFDLLLMIPGFGAGGESGWILGVGVLYVSWLIMYLMTRKPKDTKINT